MRERGFTIFSFRKTSDHMLRIKQSINGLFPLYASTGEELCELYQQNRREEEVSSFLLIRRHPDLNWGKRICSPPPYHSAMSPKWYQIDENFPGFLNFYCTYILTPVLRNPFPKRRTPLFDCICLIHPYDWLYSISKYTMLKGFSRFSIEKSNVYFQPANLNQ